MVNDDRFNIREELRTKELVKQDELRNVGSIPFPELGLHFAALAEV